MGKSKEKELYSIEQSQDSIYSTSRKDKSPKNVASPCFFITEQPYSVDKDIK